MSPLICWALSFIRRIWLSTLTHVSLLICNWRRLFFFPPLPCACKLGNDLSPQGVVRRKEEACSGANVPWCYFAVSENNCVTNQHLPSHTFLVNYCVCAVRTADTAVIRCTFKSMHLQTHIVYKPITFRIEHFIVRKHCVTASGC
jgi:hypothetical protein